MNNLLFGHFIKQKGFTLIEILIAVVILSLTVFGVLSMLSTNINQSILLEQNKDIYDSIKNSKECIEKFGFSYLSGVTSTESLNFGNDNTGCFTGTYNDDLNFTGIILQSYSENNKIGSNEYWSYFSLDKTMVSSGYISVNNIVSDGKIKHSLNYKIFK